MKKVQKTSRRLSTCRITFGSLLSSEELLKTLYVRKAFTAHISIEQAFGESSILKRFLRGGPYKKALKTYCIWKNNKKPSTYRSALKDLIFIAELKEVDYQWTSFGSRLSIEDLLYIDKF